MATNFEQMSNDELRQQMETYGLPKVPITASTRNILIKRLQNHVKDSSSPAKATNKSRRETIHVVAKYSSDDDSDRDAAKEKLKKKLDNHKNARRQTIGGAGKSPAAPAPPPPVVPAEKPGRKSLRATPTKTTRIPEIVTTQRIHNTIPMVIEDSDEEDDVPLVKPAPAPLSRRSKSKTPTLAKSDLVTTSYKQVVDTVHEDRRREEEEEEEAMEQDEQSDLEEQVPLATRYQRRTYDEMPEPVLKPVSIRISPLRRTTLAGGSFRYEPSPAIKPEGFSHSYSRPSIATTSYTSSYSNKYSSAAAAKQPDDEPEPEFPYLREFSKRLSTLKAEAPLYKRTSAPLSTSSSRTTTTSYTSSRLGNYRPTTERESHFWDPILRFFGQLERKYALKQKVLILLAILIVIFVLVMFWN